jgi:hypothetical protein
MLWQTRMIGRDSSLCECHVEEVRNEVILLAYLSLLRRGEGVVIYGRNSKYAVMAGHFNMSANGRSCDCYPG